MKQFIYGNLFSFLFFIIGWEFAHVYDNGRIDLSKESMEASFGFFLLAIPFILMTTAVTELTIQLFKWTTNKEYSVLIIFLLGILIAVPFREYMPLPIILFLGAIGYYVGRNIVARRK